MANGVTASPPRWRVGDHAHGLIFGAIRRVVIIHRLPAPGRPDYLVMVPGGVITYRIPPHHLDPIPRQDQQL